MKREPLVHLFFASFLGLAVGIGSYFTFGADIADFASKLWDEPPEPVKEKVPARINVTLLGMDCEYCDLPTMNETIEYIRSENDVEVVSTQELSIEGSRELAAKYNITRLPATIITGDIDTIYTAHFVQSGDGLIYEFFLPFYDLTTNKIEGSIQVIKLTDPTCTVCFNISTIIDRLYPARMNVTEISSSSIDGKRLIENYNIEFLPTVIFEKHFIYSEEGNTSVKSRSMSVEKDGKLVIRLANPPYRDLSTGEIKGIVDVTFLLDESCEDCYNVSSVPDILSDKYTLVYGAVKDLDIASQEGKEIIEKYNITYAPTFVFSKDAILYVRMPSAWPLLGTKETDGNLVFRNISAMKSRYKGEDLIYKNLISGDKITE